MLIRPGVPADAATIQRIRVAGWREAYRGIVPDEILTSMDTGPGERLIRRLSGHDPRQSFLVAEDDHDVVGFANFGPYRVEETGSLHEAVGELYAIYVDPRHWRKGAGTALLHPVVEQLNTAGLSPVRLWVLRDNHPARRFYERHGFSVDGATQLYQPAPHIELPEVRYAK